PRLLIGLVVLALAFIVAAVIWGSSGGEEEAAPEAPAPAPATAEGPDEAPASQTAEALGYPSFATNNTVRIGGADAAANAAGAALAAFPSTTAEQRPAAVTLVDEGDWGGAIAASVLMASPVRAPILFSDRAEIPKVTDEALAALDPQGSEETGGVSLFVIGEVAVPERPGQGLPIDAGDPAATAAQLATLRDRLFGEAPEHIVVASSDSPEFAMPAAAWAARSGDPVLFSGARKLPAATAKALEKHPKAPVFVLGPSAAISKDVVEEIDEIAGRVERVAGKDPAASALALARYDQGSFGWNVNDPGHGFVLARSDSPANAAAAAPLSASGTWGPLLLTEAADRLPDAVRSYFLDLKPGYTTDPTRAFYNHVWVIGDEAAIDVSQQAEVNELAELAKIGGEE
ncbi:MAG TPA: cell wall-binding repeat-containing protein, partial [Solirubrobacterales bacterium]|nr:cell wall-binding repeat-containing protein [Solirubrobacterales bacterium]